YFQGTVDFDPSSQVQALTSAAAAGKYDGYVAKYSSTGGLLWVRQLVSSGQGYGEAGGVAVDAAGNVFVAGGFGGTATLGGITLTSTGVGGGFVAKLDSAGTVLWAHALALGAGDGYADQVALDDADNAYVTGGFQGTAAFGNISLTSAGSDDGFVA